MWWFGAVGFAALVTGCTGAAQPSATRYPLTGQLIAVLLDTSDVLLAHEAIAGYMDAMTMPFRVADPTTIRDRRRGDVITATRLVGSDANYLEDVVMTGRAAFKDAASTRPFAEGLHILAPGEVAPYSRLTDLLAAHAARVGAGAADGRVTTLRSGNDWSADEVLADLRLALAGAPPSER